MWCLWGVTAHFSVKSKPKEEQVPSLPLRKSNSCLEKLSDLSMVTLPVTDLGLGVFLPVQCFLITENAPSPTFKVLLVRFKYILLVFQFSNCVFCWLTVNKYTPVWLLSMLTPSLLTLWSPDVWVLYPSGNFAAPVGCPTIYTMYLEVAWNPDTVGIQLVVNKGKGSKGI